MINFLGVLILLGAISMAIASIDGAPQHLRLEVRK
jgi:hypothetical protein